ncbi:MAG: efflux RND transporter periplasmic adaptor subunit [Acidobacteria bacterium]|nr:efflux RND transporter periplasmic adaptor subunit [Acidobacteriota bacterium]
MPVIWSSKFKLSSGLAAALLLAACGKQESPSDKPAGPPKAAAAAAPVQKQLNGEVVMDPAAPELKQMTVEEIRDLPVPVDEVTVTARIQANPHSVGHAVVPVPGRITRVLARLGDSVTKGQPLVSIESPAVSEAEAAFVQSEAMLRQAEIAQSKADADLARLTDLFEHQAVAQKEVLSAKTTSGLTKASVDQARGAREQARRRLELLGLKPGEFQQQVVVHAPISGKVMEVSVVEGEFRNEINTPLVTITDLSRVWVTSEVPESKIRLFHVGGIAHLDLIAYPDETFHAKVTRIADAVDPETRTLKVNAELENTGGKLRPDMFGSLRYSTGETPAPWIPETAVVRRNGIDLIFVERAPGRFAAVPVELGKPIHGGFPVGKGAKAGDRIVTKGSVYLKAAL